MTDAQLYLAIGIPSVLFSLNFLGVLATGFWQAKRFEDMSKRFDDMKELFRAENASMRAENASMRTEFLRLESTLHAELRRVEGVLSTKIDALGSRVKALEESNQMPLIRK